MPRIDTGEVSEVETGSEEEVITAKTPSKQIEVAATQDEDTKMSHAGEEEEVSGEEEGTGAGTGDNGTEEEYGYHFCFTRRVSRRVTDTLLKSSRGIRSGR